MYLRLSGEILQAAEIEGEASYQIIKQGASHFFNPPLIRPLGSKRYESVASIRPTH
jgi:hypothetical protein